MKKLVIGFFIALTASMRLINSLEISNPFKKRDLQFLFGKEPPSHEPLYVHVKTKSRERRSVQGSREERVVVEFPGHIDLTLKDGDTEVELELHPNNDLISQNFKLVVRGKKGEIEEDVAGIPLRNCLYIGRVKGKSNTAAALSSCDGNGYTGVLINGAQSHLIRPVTSEKTIRPKRQTEPEDSEDDLTPDGLHIIHARNDDSKCGVFDLRAMMAPRVIIELPKNDSSKDDDTNSKLLDVEEVSQRPKRETNRKYLIETAVFVDDEMYRIVKEKHGDQVIEALRAIVLAIMNGVYILYNAPSLRTNINLSLVRLDIFKEKINSLGKADGEIDRYLANFCLWQRKQKDTLAPDGDKDPNFWDHGILLSGVDLWEGTKSFTSVIGLAWVAGMCTKSYSCTINEGTSFEAVYVIAHEMGHNLNMSHDGSKSDGNSCPSDIYIMSSSTGPGKVTWSVCSNRELERFLSSVGAFCLWDVQRTSREIEITPNGKLPGQIYDIKRQCLFSLGDSFSPYVTGKFPYNNVCRELWCQNRTHALRTHPALEGSPCGSSDGKLCISGGCVTDSEREQVIIATIPPDFTFNEIPEDKPSKNTPTEWNHNYGSSFADLFINIRNMFNKYLFMTHEHYETRLAEWVLFNLTKCSANCGGGWQTGTVVCRKKDSEIIVKDSDCDRPRPPSKTSCNTLPCIRYLNV